MNMIDDGIVKKMSLDKESARLVHAERMVLEKMTLTAKAIERGYLDYMMRLEKPDWVDFTAKTERAAGLECE